MSGDPRVSDPLLHEMFERRARRGSGDGLRGSILATTGSTRQHAAGLRLLARRRTPLRLLAVAALLATVGTGLVVVASRPHEPPLPTTRMPGFVRAFDYADVPGTGFGAPVLSSGFFVAFAAGGSEAYPEGAGRILVPGAHGVTVSSTQGAMTHPCPPIQGGASRVAVREDPDGFLEDLRSIAGAGIGEAAPATLDGREALAATVDPITQRCVGLLPDYHVNGGGLAGFVRLDIPSRLVLTRVGGMTLVLQAWAATPEELAAWTPKANQFLDHIHFVDATAP